MITPSLSSPSETFIRAHIGRIAPGQTATVAWKGLTAGEVLGAPGPHLMLSEPLRRLANPFSRRFTRADGKRLVGFLKGLGSPPVLVEYGPTALRVAKDLKRAGSRMVVHFHGSDVAQRLRFRKAQYSGVFAQASAIVAPSQFLIDKLLAVGCPSEKAHVIPCGVDASAFPDPAPEPGRLIAVGRMVTKKAPLVTIAAFARIARAHPGAHLDMVGKGVLLGQARQLVRDLDMQDRVTLHGALPHDEVKDLLARASIFLQHSVTAANGDTEGMPVAVLEAMSMGLGIVSTLHSGIPEAVRNGIDGLLVPEGDEAADGGRDRAAS